MAPGMYNGRDDEGNPLPTEQVQRDFYFAGIDWFSTRESGFIYSVAKVKDHLEALNRHMGTLNLETKILNENIKQASSSSEKLSRSLNRLTFIGAIIALLGLLVAGSNLYLEYKFKYSSHVTTINQPR